MERKTTIMRLHGSFGSSNGGVYLANIEVEEDNTLGKSPLPLEEEDERLQTSDRVERGWSGWSLDHGKLSIRIPYDSIFIPKSLYSSYFSFQPLHVTFFFKK